MLRALVFDFDGVILETEEPEFLAWQEAWANHGVVLRLDEWVACIGTVGVFDPVAELVARARRPVDVDALQALRRRRNRELISGRAVNPGVEALLEECATRRLPVAVASSSERRWVEDHLARVGLLDAFSFLSCYDGTCPPKPAPDLYRRALDALGVEPQHALAIEDSPNGVAAAVDAGLVCVAVPGPLTRHLDLGRAHLRLETLAGETLAGLLDRVAAAGTRRLSA